MVEMCTNWESRAIRYVENGRFRCRSIVFISLNRVIAAPNEFESKSSEYICAVNGKYFNIWVRVCVSVCLFALMLKCHMLEQRLRTVLLASDSQLHLHVCENEKIVTRNFSQVANCHVRQALNSWKCTLHKEILSLMVVFYLVCHRFIWWLVFPYECVSSLCVYVTDATSVISKVEAALKA